MFLMMLKKDTTQFMSIFKRMPTGDGDATVIRRRWLIILLYYKINGDPRADFVDLRPVWWLN